MHHGVKSAFAGAAAVAASFALTPTGAHAKQCIWNKGSYVLDVRWYRPADLVLYNTDPGPGGTGDWVLRNDLSINAERPPVKVDRFPVAQGRCNDTNEALTAVISVVGGATVGEPPVQPHRPIVASALVHMNFRFIYRQWGPPEPGTNWPSTGFMVNRVLNSSGGFVMPNGATLPPVHSAHLKKASFPHDVTLILVTTPSTTHYLDFWGLARNPEWGQGGPIKP